MIFFFIFIVAAIFAIFFTPLVILAYRKLRILDDPHMNPHPKVVHTSPLPRGGGIVIFVSIALTALIFLPLSKHLIAILIGGFFLMMIGIWDDIYDPSPIVRLIAQICAALIPIAAGIGIAYITNPFGGIIHLSSPQITFSFFNSLHTVWIISDMLALIWIVWCMNSINFSKGLDGQMPGYVTIAAVVIALLSLRFTSDPTQRAVTYLAIIVAGAFFGFLVHNFYPQKIMSGFGASNLAGYFLSILALLSGAKLATAILVLAIPMIDAAFVVFNRLLEHRSPLRGDRTHLHHKLMDLGWGKRRIAVFYWICTAILGFLSLQLNSEQKMFTITVTAIILIGFLLWFRFFFQQFENSDHDNG